MNLAPFLLAGLFFKGDFMSTEISIVIVVVALITGLTAASIAKKPDGPVEEVAEQLIKDQTGWDIDFTPDDDGNA